MSMQPQTWSISGLAVELGMDRRTLAKRLAHVPPVTGTGRRKRWRLADVLAELNRHERLSHQHLGSGRTSDRRVDARHILEQCVMPKECLVPWLPENAKGLRELGLVLDFPAAAKQQRVSKDELFHWWMLGAPVLPPAPGEDVGRFSIPHLFVWRVAVKRLCDE